MNQKQIKNLKEEYVKKLLDKSRQITKLWQQWNLGDLDSRYELQRLLHNLFVSASMHGFHKIAKFAKSAENKLLKKKDNQQVVGDIIELTREIWLSQGLVGEQNKEGQ